MRHFFLQKTKTKSERRYALSNETPGEIGQTVRLALQLALPSWGATVRLILLMLTLALACGLFDAVRHLPLTMW